MCVFYFEGKIMLLGRSGCLSHTAAHNVSLKVHLPNALFNSRTNRNGKTEIEADNKTVILARTG